VTGKEFSVFAKDLLLRELGPGAYVRTEWTGKSGVVWARYPLADNLFGYWSLQRRHLAELRAEVAISRGQRNPGEFGDSGVAGREGYRARLSTLGAVPDWWPAATSEDVIASTRALLAALKELSPTFYERLSDRVATGA
jgi:hypothetical protein